MAAIPHLIAESPRNYYRNRPALVPQGNGREGKRKGRGVVQFPIHCQLVGSRARRMDGRSAARCAR
jgi:hypothetical protein